MPRSHPFASEIHWKFNAKVRDWLIRASISYVCETDAEYEAACSKQAYRLQKVVKTLEELQRKRKLVDGDADGTFNNLKPKLKLKDEDRPFVGQLFKTAFLTQFSIKIPPFNLPPANPLPAQPFNSNKCFMRGVRFLARGIYQLAFIRIDDGVENDIVGHEDLIAEIGALYAHKGLADLDGTATPERTNFVLEYMHSIALLYHAEGAEKPSVLSAITYQLVADENNEQKGAYLALEASLIEGMGHDSLAMAAFMLHAADERCDAIALTALDRPTSRRFFESWDFERVTCLADADKATFARITRDMNLENKHIPYLRKLPSKDEVVGMILAKYAQAGLDAVDSLVQAIDNRPFQ